MEAALLRHHRPAVGLPRLRRNPTRKPNCFLTVRAVLTSRPTDRHETSTKIIPEKSTYNDNWYDRMAINYLSQSFQTTTGVKNIKTGYDSLVDAASVVSKKFRTNEQQELVVQTLTNAIPQPILATIKGLLPPSKFAREYFAVFTTIFFAWLIGPCEVKDSEIDGRIEKNIVNIPKCRFLDETRCVGMCVNLCKMPSQKFIKDSLGMPLNMVPNFEDMSCQMIFGQEPPAQSDDPALKQPCYKLLCKSKQKHTSDCSS